MKILCVFGEHNYGNPSRGYGYEYTNFMPALKSLGHETIFFESLNKSCYKDFIDLNRQLLEVVESEKPDLIIFVLMTYEIWLESLQLIRQGSNAALLHWATDDSWKYEQSSRYISSCFDLFATTYPSAMTKAHNDGLDNFVLTQWAADSSKMLAPLKAEECRYQVSFIGSTYGNRKKWVERLKECGLEVKTFGYGWPSGPVEAEELPRIIRNSIISLNFSDSGVVIEGGRPVRSRQIKARVFEVPGAGGLLATQDADYLGDYYEIGKEIIVFKDADDLVDKIRYLLAHPEERDAIAQAGFFRTKAEHSYETRFSPLIDEAVKCRANRVGAKSGIDFLAFESVSKTHSQHWLLSFLKCLLLFPCFLLLGKQRGPRAARRILFEFSWRIFGKKTYSASGWASRLFYLES